MSDLKIIKVETILLSYRYKENELWKWSGGTTLQRNAVLVRIKTNKDIDGIGEIGESAFLPLAVERIVSDRFAPMLLNEDPVNIEKLWQKMYVRSAHWGRKGVTIPIISGLEIALWDILGKLNNKPLYELIGGIYRDKIRVYASAGMSKDTNEIIKEAKEYINQGYKGFKMRIGNEDPKSDIEKVKMIREAIGYDVDLMVDAGQCYVDFPWDYNKALNVAKELESYKPFWLEEPLPPDDIEGYILLANSTNIPIAAGENEFTRYGFKDLIVKRAADIIQPDVTRSGGISECKKIAAIASAYNMRCAPHIFGAGAGFMANMHFIASTPNAFIMEYDKTFNPLRDELLIEKPTYESGYIKLIKGLPGLGVKLTDEIINKFPFINEDAVEKNEFTPIF
ncbi:MAG: mandelate racemase/muconate lactonizing enzyme family protein [Actinobacteria bacterium]|nr:mandelate racemase/muconate lactonizing enzyme family protein [Cyanobacteriota bacterium]MCL5772578.1 mandelate racemase/muconate lactonizing enzyme family protein [Actinomycetota bacterium]